MLDRHHDEDYTYFVYSVPSIKSELGLPPHTRNGIFEKKLVELDEDRQISVLEWIIRDDRGELVECRMLEPSDTIRIIVEYYKALPDKKKKKIEEKAECLIHEVAYDEGWFDDLF